MRNKITKFSSRIIICIMVLFGVLQLQAQDKNFKYTDSWGKEGFSITQQTKGSVEINFSINQFNLNTSIIDGEALQTISLADAFLPNNAGAPNLPGLSKYIAIPQGSTPILKVVSYRTEVIKDANIAPAPVIPLDTDNSPLDYSKDSKIYHTNANFPVNPVIISEPKQIRGVDVVMLGITPFQYNPVTKELIAYRDIKVEITFDGGNGQYGDNRYRSRWFDPILEDAILNYDALPVIDYAKNINNADLTGYEYLIISPTNPEFQQWADSIKKFRTEQGIYTGIVTLNNITNGNTAAGVEAYINNAYSTWDIPPVAILILGDYGTTITNSVIAPIWDSYCVSDNIYGDVNADDMPEIVMARIVANNATELTTMVTKFLNYERNPPTASTFYDHPITALGWQTERWFQICSEVVGGFWRNAQAKHPVRINAVYQGNPASDPWSTATNTSTVVSYFGPSGLNYITATPQGIGGFTGGTAAQVVTAINAGSFMLQHRDHGAETGWGEPAFQSSNISSLTNTDLTFIMSINCLTGKYNYSSECFAEKFHRWKYNGSNSGALGLLAASEVSYSFVNDTYIWGVYDNLWPNFMPANGTTPASRDVLPAFGNAAGKYFLQASSWPYNTSNKEVTYNLFHMLGDAFQTVYSEVPQNLTITHNPTIVAGATTFNITANAGSFIALTAGGVILGTGVGTGSSQAITIPAQVPPTQIIVTVTKQNYFRYRSIVNVIAGTSPYIVLNSYTTTATPNFGTSVGFNVTLENVAGSPYNASNVVATLSTTNTNVTITDNTENYGTINAGATSLKNNAFAINIANNVPDQTNVSFNIHSTGTYNANNYTWDSPLNLIVNAPVMTIGGMTISDPTPGNNNGRLDPGETVTITIQNSNTGHANCTGAVGTLTESSPYVTITSGTCNIGNINAGASANSTYTVTADVATPIGTLVSFNYDLTSGQYNATKVFGQPIGLIYEDWETNTFTKFPWVNTAPSWTLVGSGAQYEGLYAAKSATISHSGTTSLYITWDVSSNDSIKFYKKVSSESNYDYLKFFIDAAETGSWSGTTDVWSLVKYPVSAGTRIFKWTYSKDGSVSSGSDCAWIDYIVFPAGMATTIGIENFSNNGVGLDCYPNPFNQVTTFTYSLNEPSDVVLTVYNTFGKEVSVLVDSKQSIGSHNILFNGDNLSSGVYYCVLKAGDKVITKKITITK